MIGFDGTDTRTKSRTELCDRLWAKELQQAVAKTTMTRPTSKVKNEAHVFRLMRVSDKRPVELIDEVLSWHCKHLRDKYQPKAFTASEFRKKFIKLRTMYLISGEAPKPEIKLNQYLSGVVARLKALGWTKGLSIDLQNEVYYSWQFITDFQSYLYERSTDEHDPDRALCQFVYERFPRNWTETHYQDVHTYQHKINSRLENHRLTKEHVTFRSKMLHIVEEYAGRSKGMYKFLQLIEDYHEGRKTRRRR